jgi:hypothetical protein
MDAALKRTRNKVHIRYANKVGGKGFNSLNKTPLSESYDASRYIKGDLKWSVISTGIVLVVMLSLYVVFH